MLIFLLSQKLLARLLDYAGLMSPGDKTNLDNLVASSGGVLSVSGGNGILVDTSDPHTAGAPVVSVNFGAVANSGTPSYCYALRHLYVGCTAYA